MIRQTRSPFGGVQPDIVELVVGFEGKSVRLQIIAGGGDWVETFVVDKEVIKAIALAIDALKPTTNP